MVSQVKYEFWYADLKTYANTNPSKTTFWFGGLVNGKTNEYKCFSDFPNFFSELIKAPKAERTRKIVVFHEGNNFDFKVIATCANQYFKYNVNPPKNGLEGSIYIGQHTEIYRRFKKRIPGPKSPTILVDSQPMLITKLGQLRNESGRKNEIPMIDDFREPTETEKKALYLDILLIKNRFQENLYEQEVLENHLTLSSITQANIKKQLAKANKKRYKKQGFRLSYQQPAEKPKKAYPTAVIEKIEKEVLEFDERETNYREDGTAVCGVSQKVLNEYRSKLLQVYSKALENEIDGFKSLQKNPTDQFWNIPCPDIEIPDGHDLAVKYHNFMILQSVNEDIQAGLRGGVSVINNRYWGKTIPDGVSIDANSMYPSVILKYRLPYTYLGSSKGLEPNKGKYYVACIKRLRAKIKRGKQPILKRPFKFTDDFAYPRYFDWKGKISENGVWDTVLCSVDIDLLYMFYDVEILEYGEVFYFGEDENFTIAVRNHVKEWRAIKEHSPKNSVEYEKAKMMLNQIWGRWAMFDKRVDDAGKDRDVGDKDTNLVSAIFVTAYARFELAKMINRFGSKLFVYSDTDSVHVLFSKEIMKKSQGDLTLACELLEKELKDLIHPTEFGKWKIEKDQAWNQARYLKQKTYAHAKNNRKYLDVTAAGFRFPKKDLDLIDFKRGLELTQLQVCQNEYGMPYFQPMTFTL